MYGVFIGALAVAAIVAFFWSCASVVKNGGRQAWGAVAWNIVILFGVGGVALFFFPMFANYVYRYVWLNIFRIIPVLVGILILLALLLIDTDTVSRREFDHRSRAMKRRSGSHIPEGIAVLWALIFIGLGPVLVHTMENRQTCKAYTPTRIGAIRNADPGRIRFTPLQVAYKDMVQTINTAQYTVEEDLTDPVMVDGGFGYVAPVTPDGFWSTFLNKTNGFVLYHDGSNLSADQKRRRINQPFETGEGMEWTDNVYRRLYAKDRSCRFTEVHYLQLHSDRPDELTGFAPKIEYDFQFPCFFIPRWGGVALIYADGRIVEYTADEVLRHPELSDRQVFPVSLAEEMVNVQVYDAGYKGAFYNRDGKIEVPELPGDNQWPFYMIGDDGRQVYVTATEPAGQAYALFRIYYVDAHDGTFECYEYPVNDGLIGPVKAIERIKAIPGYKWVENSGESTVGDFRIIEPVYVTVNGELYWKYSITTKSYTGIVETVIVKARSTAEDPPLRLRSRPEFESWLSGERDIPDAVVVADANPSIIELGDITTIDRQVKEMRALMIEMFQRINHLDSLLVDEQIAQTSE